MFLRKFSAYLGLLLMLTVFAAGGVMRLLPLPGISEMPGGEELALAVDMNDNTQYGVGNVTADPMCTATANMGEIVDTPATGSSSSQGLTGSESLAGTLGVIGVITAMGGRDAGTMLNLGGGSVTSVTIGNSGTTKSVSLATKGGGLSIDSSGNTTYTTNYRTAAYLDSTQAIGSSGVVAFSKRSFGSGYNTGSHRYTAPCTGCYLLRVNIYFYPSLNNRTYAMYPRINGSRVAGQGASSFITGAGSGRYFMLNYSGILELSSGDTLDIYYAGQNSDRIEPDYTSMHIHFLSR